MAPQSDGLPLLSYALMVWRRRVLVLIAALGMALPAYAVSALQTSQYEAIGEILLTRQQLDENLNVSPGVLTDTQVNNQIAVLTGPEVANRARQQGAVSPIRVVGSTGSNVVTLSTEDTNPQQAAATVEAYVRAFSEYRTQQVRQTLDNTAAQLQNRIATLQEQINKLAPADRLILQQQQATVQEQLGRVQIQLGLVSSGLEVVQNPTANPSPVRPTPVRNALLALVLGLALGISLAILLETLQRRSTVGSAAPRTGNRADDANGERPDVRSVAYDENGRTPSPSRVADDSS